VPGRRNKETKRAKMYGKNLTIKIILGNAGN